MLPIGWTGIPKSPSSRYLLPALAVSKRSTNPHRYPPLLSMTPLPVCSKSTMPIQPKPIFTTVSPIKTHIVAGRDNKIYRAIKDNENK